MKVILDNAQSGGPKIEIVDDKGIILKQVAFCEDGVLINEELAEKRDDIVIFEA